MPTASSRRSKWFITLFLIPLATVVVSGFAHREARRGREDEAVGLAFTA